MMLEVARFLHDFLPETSLIPPIFPWFVQPGLGPVPGQQIFGSTQSEQSLLQDADEGLVEQGSSQEGLDFLDETLTDPCVLAEPELKEASEGPNTHLVFWTWLDWRLWMYGGEE